jgi:adenylyl- and sulfurtransferase ThiI
MTLNDSLKSLVTENQLIQVLLANLRDYTVQAHSKLNSVAYNESRKKLFIVNTKYSHHEEIDERLQFIKYLASVSPDYQVSKSDLDIVYELTV